MTQKTDFKAWRQELLTTAVQRADQKGAGTGRRRTRAVVKAAGRSMADIRRDEKHHNVRPFDRRSSHDRNVIDNRLYDPAVRAALEAEQHEAGVQAVEGLTEEHVHGEHCEHDHTEVAAPVDLAQGIQAIVHTQAAKGKFLPPRAVTAPAASSRPKGTPSNP